MFFRSQHATEWTTNDPPSNIGTVGQLAIDDTGGDVSTLYARGTDAWTAIGIVPGNMPVTGLATDVAGSQVTLRPSAANEDFTVAPSGTGEARINRLVQVTEPLGEELALRIDTFGTIDTDFDFTGITFNVTPTAQTHVTYRTIAYYVTYTNVSGVWTQRFYTVTGHTGTTVPFWTVQITS